MFSFLIGMTEWGEARRSDTLNDLCESDKKLLVTPDSSQKDTCEFRTIWSYKSKNQETCHRRCATRGPKDASAQTFPLLIFAKHCSLSLILVIVIHMSRKSLDLRERLAVNRPDRARPFFSAVTSVKYHSAPPPPEEWRVKGLLVP